MPKCSAKKVYVVTNKGVSERIQEVLCRLEAGHDGAHESRPGLNDHGHYFTWEHDHGTLFGARRLY